MILQTLDIEGNCKGIFHQGAFLFDDFEENLKEYSVAWKHSELLDDEKYRYLYLTTKEEDLSAHCHDPDLFLEYRKAREKMVLFCQILKKVTIFQDYF